jgi:hypothetical protein
MESSHLSALVRLTDMIKLLDKPAEESDINIKRADVNQLTFTVHFTNLPSHINIKKNAIIMLHSQLLCNLLAKIRD